MRFPHSLFAVLFIIGAGIGYALTPHPQNVGAALPSATAVFETSLQSAITSSATTMTLTANAVRGGGSLSGYNCFTIDEGSAQAETVCGTVSATTVSSLSRGISQSTGTTTVAALQFAHRRGANVKITDFPVIQILKAQNNGEDTFPNALTFDAINKYSGAFAFTTQSNQLASVKFAEDYANNVIAGGAPTSTETFGGKVELGTAFEAASSTDLGVAKPTVLQTKNATDTPLSGCATGYSSLAGAGCAVIAQLTGKLRQTWLDLTAEWIFSNLFATNASSTNATTTNTVSFGTTNMRVPQSSPTASGTVMALSGTSPFQMSYVQQGAAICVSSAWVSTSNAASTTLATCVIPANTLNTSNILQGYASFDMDAAASCQFFAEFGNGIATDTPIAVLDGAGGTMLFSIAATTTNRELAQGITWVNPNNVANLSNPTSESSRRNASTTLSGTTYIALSGRTKASGPCNLSGYSIQVPYQR